MKKFKFNLQQRKLGALASFALIVTCSSSTLLASDKNMSSYEELKSKVIAKRIAERPGLEKYQKPRNRVARDNDLKVGLAPQFAAAASQLSAQMEDKDAELNAVGHAAIDLLDQAAENQIENVPHPGLKQKLVNLKNKVVNRFRRIFR